MPILRQRLIGAVAIAAVVFPASAARAYEAVVIPPPPACTATIGAVSRPTLVVSNAQVACLTGTTVHGSIIVSPGGALLLRNGLVAGNITAVNAAYLEVCSSTVRGSITAQSPTGFVHIGDAGNGHLACTSNTVRNNVSVLSGTGGYIVSGNQVGGNVVVNDNVGMQVANPYEIAGNTIGGSLTCLRNVPPPDDHGYPNIVTGVVNCDFEEEPQP